MKNIWQILKATYQEFKDDKASRLAAALSFYTALAIAPMLVLLVTAIGWFLGSGGAQAQVVEQIRGVAGAEGAEVAELVLASADRPDLVGIAGILSLLTLFWGASNIFAQLQESLNTIWDVELKPGQGIVATAKERLLSFGMILVIGFLLLVSLVLSAALTAIGNSFSQLLPGAEWAWQLVNNVVSFGVITLLFGLIYRILPDVKIAWRDVWMGAAVTALLFTIGKYLLGLYFGYQSAGSAYGAAGSLVVFLIWIYYSAQIFFFGAEFTQVYARRYGQGVVPDDKARYIDGASADEVGPDKARPEKARRGKKMRVTQPTQRASTQRPVVVQRQAASSTPSATTRLVGLIGAFLLSRRNTKKTR